MKYRQYILKRKLEDVFIFPFVMMGRLIAVFRPLPREYETFFFFPFYHTGGAEKVHAMVAQATCNANCIIYFTRKSHDDNFYNEFKRSNCTIKDISKYTDNKFLYFVNLIFRGIITGYINKQKQKPLVFNGQCNFGYKISPWLSKSIPQVELIHSFNSFSWIRIPFLPFITKTIMISKLRIDDHNEQYQKLGIPKIFKDRITYILNGIPLPFSPATKDYSKNINVLYAGRGTEEKRVHLIAEMAKKSQEKNLPASFIFMGDVQKAIPADLHNYCTFLGHQTNEEKINSIYNEAHIVIITSSTEGFPIVIEEGMARSCAIIATPVGDIPVHIKQDKNGFLFSTVGDQQKIVEEGVGFIDLLCNNKNLLQQMGDNNRQYAYTHFSIEAFIQAYQQLFKQLRNE